MYQAGIKNISLYENVGISFLHYDPLNLQAITDLSGTGAILSIANDQEPAFNIDIKLSDSGKVVQDYTLKFFIYGLLTASYDLLIQLNTSVYGWCMLFEFYDGTFKFYDTPIFCKGSKIDTQKEMTFEVEMKTAVPTSSLMFNSAAFHYDYDKDISTVPIYRADTTILTADTTIYTADYAL